MGSDQSEDEELVTKVNLEVDASLISEITITRTGAVPITVLADSASPADNEPSTLEPQMVVRNLRTPGPISSMSPPATFAEVGGRRESESELDVELDVELDGDEEERTTQNIEPHLQQVFDRASASMAAASPPPSARAPLTHLSPILLTPSEPIRLDATKLSGMAQARRPAPIPAAGRPPEPRAPEPEDENPWDKEQSEITARADAGAAELLRATAASADYDEETKTDAVSSDLVAFSRAQARTVPVVKEDPGLEPEETRTAKAPLTMASAQAAFIEAPRRAPVAVEDARSSLDAQAAVGSTVRMFFNPLTGKATVHPESERNQPVAQAHMQPFGEQPTFQVMPVQPNPATSIAPAPPRRVGRNVVLFLLACVATGAGVYFWPQISPRIMAYLPSGSSASSSTAAPTAAASSTAESTGSASAAASVSSEPVVSASAVASGASSVSPSASAAASALRNAKKRFPPLKK